MNFLTEKQYSVRACETDHLGKMRLSAVFQILQETAEMNANRLGFSYEHLAVNQEIWVLSRLHAKFTEVPNWQDELNVKTWPVGQRRIFGIRDYTISKKENVIGKITSSWVLIDTDKRTIKRMRDFPKSSLAPVFEEIAPKAKTPEDLKLVSRRIANKSELDINKHVNNAIYFNWITDSLSLDLYNNYFVSEIVVNYLHETLAGDQIAIYHGIVDNNLTIVMENESKNKTAFCATLHLATRLQEEAK